MLNRENAIRFLKRELEKTPLIQMEEIPNTALNFLFIYLEPQGAQKKDAAELIQKMGEALKLPRDAWNSIAVPEMTADSLAKVSKSVKARFVVLLASDIQIELSGAELIQADDVLGLLESPAKKLEIWNKLKSALNRL